jgi:hypothetical protein
LELSLYFFSDYILSCIGFTKTEFSFKKFGSSLPVPARCNSHKKLSASHKKSTSTNMKLTAAIILLASTSARGQEATYEPGNFSDGNKIEQ